VVGCIFKVHASPVGTPRMWTLAFGHHEDRTPTHDYQPTREAAMAAFAKSWRREECSGSQRLRSKRPHLALLEREDSALVACYHSTYAPRTGGAYDSHHRTAGVAGCTRWSCGRVAARGARAAAGDAGDRVS